MIRSGSIGLFVCKSLAQAGLAYSRDKYDIERFEEIREISVSMMAELSQVPAQKVADLFANETGYQTPKIDTRAAIFQDDKILLVQNQMENGRYQVVGAMLTNL